MRNSIILLLLCLFFQHNTVVFASQENISLDYAIPIGVGGYSATETYLSRTSTIAQSMQRHARPYTLIKGDVGERIMHDFLKGQGWTPLPTNLGTTARQGIDGIYIRYDAHGNPRHIMLAEAKFGTSQLGVTKDGVQATHDWNAPRMRNVAKNYEQASSSFRESTRHTIAKIHPPSNGTVSIIPLRDGKLVQVWRDPRIGIWMAYSEQPFSSKALADSLASHAQFLRGAAEGKITYRNILFRLAPSENSFVITTTNIDTGKTQTFNLPKQFLSGAQRHVLQAIEERIIAKTGMPQAEARKVATQVLKNAKSIQEALDKFAPVPRWSWQTAGVGALRSAGYGALLGLGLDALIQVAGTDKIDAERLGYTAILGATATGLSHLAGGYLNIVMATAGRNTLIARLPTGSAGFLAKALPSATVGLVATSIFAYGQYLLGHGSIETANRSMMIGGGASAGGHWLRQLSLT